MILKPIIKWAGGKSRLLPKILPHVPAKIRTYAEPFAGGAALFWALASETPRRYDHAILSDMNEELVVTYRSIRDEVERVIALLSTYPNEISFYMAIRKPAAYRPTDEERAATLLYLNRTCFNGLYRVNRTTGQFNVPFGKYKNPKICDANRLRAASRALQGVDIVQVDFTDVTENLKRGSFVYLDPPYVAKMGAESFTSYAQGGFGDHDQWRLAETMKLLKKRGVKAILSNADTRASRRLYEGLRIRRVSGPRSIACDGGRKAAREILVMSWDEGSEAVNEKTDSIERAALEVLRSLGALMGAAQYPDEEIVSFVARIHAKLIPLVDGRSVSRRFLAKIERLGSAHGNHADHDELVPEYIDRVLTVLEERALRPDAMEHVKTLRELVREVDRAGRDLEGSLAPKKDG